MHLLAIVGPTAVGKSALALQLALALGGEIVNADSRQVYRHMDIGTAKPSEEARHLVPHHLLDIVSPDGEFSLAIYLQLASQAIGEIHRRGRVPILVGGTGQYLWGLLEGWQVPRVAPDLSLRRSLEEKARYEGPAELYQELVETDPQSASEIDPRNVRRVIRALEVYRGTGVPASQIRSRAAPPYSVLIIGLTLDRKELYHRADARVEGMVEAGWADEVRLLQSMGYSPGVPSMSSLGYREMWSYVKGEMTLEEATQRIKVNTHRFIRHQYAWFKLKDPRIRWLLADTDALGKTTTLVLGLVSEIVPGSHHEG